METKAADTIARNVHRLRIQRKWTQSELARRAGCAQTLVSQLERGIKCPTVDTVEDIARAFGLPTWALSLPVADLADIDYKALDTLVHCYTALPADARHEIERVAAAERRYHSIT